MILLKFYKTIFTLVISLLIFGYLLNFMSNNPNPYAAIGLQNKDTDEILSTLDVNKYVEYSEEAVNITENVLDDDMILSDNLTSINDSSVEEINECMEKYKDKLDNIMNVLS